MLKVFFDSLTRLANRISPETILEVGCGEGFSTRRLVKVFGTATRYRAIEIDSYFAEQARLRNPSINIEQGSVYELPSEAADLIICLEVLEHLEKPDLALETLFRASRSHVVLSVPREPLWSFGNLARGKYIRNFGNTPGHIQKWSKSDFVEFVSQFGKVLNVASPLPWTVVLAAKR
ncbi:MAG: class I SAM-dependent methyltransferase [Acidimicrobiaceae bacterium]|nr:class I SAM-dependent methyltransferase [Acidimicrobiaceae bacterium]